MTLVATAMQSAMVARAVSQGLIDQPPHFALSRVYGVIAKGVDTTLKDPTATEITVEYTGQPCTSPPCVGGPVTSVSGLDQDRFYPLVQAQTTHSGPYSVPFYYGIGGVIEYFALNATLSDIPVPTGLGGVGVLAAGGLVFDAGECFDNMKSEAESEDIMVVNLAHLGGNPAGTIEDPTDGTILSLGDLFVQAEKLLQAIADQLTVELLLAAKSPIPTYGAINPTDPPIVAATVTTIIT